jgi:ATP-dependent Lon protease
MTSAPAPTSEVEKQLQGRTVRTGEEELFKARTRDQGSVKIIDIVRARLDTRSDSYAAEVPSLAIKDAQIDDDLVRSNECMLTDGFSSEVTLEHDPVIAQERNGRPFRIAGMRPIQMSNPNVLGILAKGRAAFTTEAWRDFLIRSIGLEPTALDVLAKMVILLRMAPFVERNFNLVELGPRGTGKSDLFQQISPYSHLISGVKTTVTKMFVNNGNGQRGLVCQYDVVCFDEVAGVSFDQKDRVHILKGCMASGEFSRGKEGIRAYAPGWDFPKRNPNEHLTTSLWAGEQLSERVLEPYGAPSAVAQTTAAWKPNGPRPPARQKASGCPDRASWRSAPRRLIPPAGGCAAC